MWKSFFFLSDLLFTADIFSAFIDVSSTRNAEVCYAGLYLTFAWDISVGRIQSAASGKCSEYC